MNQDQTPRPEPTNYMAGLFQTHADDIVTSLKAGVVSGCKAGALVVGSAAVVAGITVVAILTASLFAPKAD